MAEIKVTMRMPSRGVLSRVRDIETFWGGDEGGQVEERAHQLLVSFWGDEGREPRLRPFAEDGQCMCLQKDAQDGTSRHEAKRKTKEGIQGCGDRQGCKRMIRCGSSWIKLGRAGRETRRQHRVSRALPLKER